MRPRSGSAATSSSRPANSAEYLERSGVSAYLKDVVTLLLENRPSSPIPFIADYFQHVVQGSSPLMRAHRYIRLCERSSEAFMDNLVAAYMALDPSAKTLSGSSLQPPHVTVAAYSRLVQLLSADLPVDVAFVVLAALGPGKREQDEVSFAQFVAGIEACLHYEDFFEEAELLFADVQHEAERAHVPVQAYALAVLEQALSGEVASPAGAEGQQGALAGALRRATRGEASAEATSALQRAERAGRGPAAANSVGGGAAAAANAFGSASTLDRDVFSRALFMVSTPRGAHASVGGDWQPSSGADHFYHHHPPHR